MSYESLLLFGLGIVGLFGVIVAVMLFVNAKKQQTQSVKSNRIKSAIAVVILACLPFVIFNVFDPLKKTNWQEFSSKDGNFVVQMPGVPVETKNMINGTAFSTELHTFSVKIGSSVYGVSYFDFPKDVSLKTPEEVINASRDGAISNINGRLLSEQPISLDGYPGKDVVIEVAKMPPMRMRLFMMERRIYNLSAITTEAQDAEKFVTSFKLLNK